MTHGLKGCGLVFLAFPIAHAVVQACFDWGLAEMAGTLFLIAGFGFLLGSLAAPAPRGMAGPSGSVQATMGLAAGFLLWAAIGEVPHQTGRGLHVGPDHWGILAVVAVSYLLLGVRRAAARCRGAQIAWEFFLVVWALHVLLLTAYYDPRFGVRSWLTALVLAAVVLVLPWLVRRARQIHEVGQGIRVGVLVAGLLWTGVEILMKWGWLPKPWKPMNPWAIAGCVGALAVWWCWPVTATFGTGRPPAVPPPPRR